MSNNEYSGGMAPQGGACSYATLTHYNGDHMMGPTMQGPNAPGQVTGSYVVPVYGAPGYDTLTHGKSPSCAGYFSIQGAYGKGASQCSTRYVQKMCQ
jgi:hypothetical protein